MVKKLDEATKLLIESLPENLQILATNAMDIGYMSRMDFTNDEILAIPSNSFLLIQFSY